MTSNWKTVRNTLLWLLVAVITMGIVISSPYLMKSSAASLPTVNSCKGITVKQIGNEWVTVNNKGAQVNYTGVAQNKYGWWRVENGRVNFKATGIYQNDYGWWRVETGKVNFKANEIYQNSLGWWKTTGGKVTFKETGVYHNQYGWWYCKNSKVDFGFTGIASNSFGLWYVEKGHVDFNENGGYQYNGKSYILKDSKATEITERMLIAVESAREVSSEFALSRAHLYNDLLEDEYGFTKQEVEFAVDNAGIDYKSQCLLAATDLLLDDDLNETGVSREFLKEMLLEVEEFTDSEVNYALSIIDEDASKDKNFWNRQALVAAQDFVDIAKEAGETITKAEILEDLTDLLGFTKSEAQYAADNVKM